MTVDQPLLNGFSGKCVFSYILDSNARWDGISRFTETFLCGLYLKYNLKAKRSSFSDLVLKGLQVPQCPYYLFCLVCGFGQEIIVNLRLGEQMYRVICIQFITKKILSAMGD